jgi:cAMP phosphodiesterase
LKDRFYALSKREQGFLIVGLLGVAVFLLAELVFLPTYQGVQRLCPGLPVSFTHMKLPPIISV